ncbi:MAG: hypothetical protein QQW96_18315 [Tychonema bourrellyi B0820]|jgi:hypothetical protein|uniref:Uncharacterized protein n=1 Tax=Tychonema bourrellyi FEM_GT703 TaxID=2040638 RepID=A0A2G4F4U0_9CYAN|nr:hypothetical protein [Tychonema bourrellyi]MDQ2099589.1 hypothetical protein [Tychonema bourrellyi B0820]PHX56770.1 hypothetical protein CP500_003950 [Tychonema bourrellyi FEM_GT703]
MKSQTSWLEKSVQEFFGNYNWLGKSLETQNGFVPGQLLTLTMPVSEFFRAISWEGIPEVGAMPPPPPMPVISVYEPAEVTIDDLFDLF